MPLKEELLPFVGQIKVAALHFGKSTRTIRRWLAAYDLYCPNKRYQPGKVTPEMAGEVRRLDRENLTQAGIAKLIGISQPMVGRIINRGFRLGGGSEVTFKTNQDTHHHI